MLKEEVLETTESQQENKTQNYRARHSKKTSMEKAETIRAFVELQKLKTQITKTLIDSHEKEFKLLKESDENQVSLEGAALLDLIKKSQKV